MDSIKKKLLIVEDDPGLQSQMRWCFEGTEVYLADDRESALNILRREEPVVVTLDLGLPPDPGGSAEGFKTLKDILRLAPETKVIVVTGREEKENAVKAIAMGATDFFQKPLDGDILTFVVERAFRIADLELRNKVLGESKSDTKVSGIVAASQQMYEICRTVEKIAPTDITTLVLGETGTGKEVLARAIHQLSSRKKKPFQAINCAAIPENLLESELFGYEKGAFTGASGTKKGKVELADTGTLFLDEIGDMPMPLQAKMLRFLQERVIERVGGVSEIAVDVRVVCATHKNILEQIEEGGFRQDLYYRISEITLEVPPLRERDEDCIVIAQAVLKSTAKEMDRGAMRLGDDAINAIRAYSWPGNVREVINKVRRAVIMAEGKIVTARDLDLEIDEEGGGYDEVFNLRRVRERAEKQAIRQALEMSAHNMSKAAKLLGITRPTLYSLTDKYQLNS